MSNKRNPRRAAQRIRAEISRAPVKRTAAMDAFIASQPAERKRKADEKRWSYWRAPTRKQQKQSSRNWLDSRAERRRRTRMAKNARKPRVVYGKTYWSHSHDV